MTDQENNRIYREVTAEIAGRLMALPADRRGEAVIEALLAATIDEHGMDRLEILNALGELRDAMEATLLGVHGGQGPMQ